MKISTEQKIDNFRNMRGMITDYRIQHNRLPTNAEFAKKLGMHPTTVRTYKRHILNKEKEKLLQTFQDEMIVRVKDVVKSIDENIEIFETIRDDTTTTSDTKMSAAKSVIDSKLDVIRIMRDGPDFLEVEYGSNNGSNNGSKDIIDNDNVSNEQKHIHRKAKSKKSTT